MIEEIKILLKDRADLFTDAEISLALKMALIEVEDYCGRELDLAMELCAQQIAIIKLNRIGTEGLASQSLSGISESYMNGYPEDIMQILNRKRKIRVM